MSVTSTERAELGYGLSEEEGEDFWLFGILTTIKISADDTDGQYCLIDAEVPPGMGSPWHRHRDEDEWFYVRDGEFTVYVGDDHLTLTAGGFAFGPKGVPHTFIAGPDGGKMLFGVGAKWSGSEVRARIRRRGVDAVGVCLGEQSVEVVAGERPLEGCGDLFVAAAEGE
jgi:quercetin dioxygenase-like cupin family protein